MTGPTPDAAEMAAKLTKAQRDAVSAGGPFATSIPSLTSAATRCALQRRGLVVDRMYATALTPLGLAIRQLLQKDQDDV